MARRKWSDHQLLLAVKVARSLRQVLLHLGLQPAGGNYVQVKRRINDLGLDTTHFLGKGWNVGMKFRPSPAVLLKDILQENSTYQSYKLKNRLYRAGLKEQKCEQCGWNKKSDDGRIPLELDHINGIRTDNRLTNLRILCPNCHSLQPTHRGLNKVK